MDKEMHDYPLDLLKSVVVTRIMSGTESLGYLPVFSRYVKKGGRWCYSFELTNKTKMESLVSDKLGEFAEKGYVHRECLLMDKETNEYCLLASFADTEEKAKEGLDAELVRAYFKRRGIERKEQVDELVDWFMHYMENMPVYGIHEGVAREGNVVAAAYYTPEDYGRLFGKGLDEYKDYLIERQDFLDGIKNTEAVKIIHVPFDPDDYKEWFKKKVAWLDGSEARSAWALEKAKDPAALRALSEKYPVRPAAPVEEKREARAFGALVPLFLAEEDEARAAGRRLPRERLLSFASKLKELLAGTEEYTKISALRCKGVKLFIGERFVSVSKTDEAEDILEQEALKLADDEGADAIMNVPSPCRVRGSEIPCGEEEEGFVLLPVVLPVVLVGSVSELDYCERLLEDADEEDLGRASEVICSMVSDIFKAKVKGSVPIVPFWEADIAADDLVSGIADGTEPEREERTGKAKLKRIK